MIERFEKLAALGDVSVTAALYRLRARQGKSQSAHQIAASIYGYEEDPDGPYVLAKHHIERSGVLRPMPKSHRIHIVQKWPIIPGTRVDPKDTGWLCPWTGCHFGWMHEYPGRSWLLEEEAAEAIRAGRACKHCLNSWARRMTENGD